MTVMEVREIPETDRAPEGAPLVRRNRLVERTCLYGSFLVATLLTFASTPDDPLITIRYAWNLLHGHGLVFNAGQYVNGATSPVGLVLAAVAILLPGGATLFKLKLFSLLFGLLTVRLGRKLLLQFGFSRYVYLVGLVLIGASPLIAYASASGLETTVAGFAVTGLVVELGRRTRRPHRALWFAALAVATRPEAALVVVTLVLVAAWSCREERFRDRIGWAWAAAAIIVVIAVGNRFYYGSWVPNTAAAKHGALWPSLTGGVDYLRWFDVSDTFSFGTGNRAIGAFALGVGLLLVVGIGVALTHWRRYRWVLGAVTAQAAFVLWSGGDWMTGDRFLEPVVPALVVLQLAGVVGVAGRAARLGALPGDEDARSQQRMTIRTRALGSLIALALGITSLVVWWRPAAVDPVWNMTSLTDRAVVASGGFGPYSALWSAMPALARCAQPGQTVASTEVGELGWSHLDLQILDLRGLTDREIATTAPVQMKEDIGVYDTDWYQPTSVVGRAIQRVKPVILLGALPMPWTAIFDPSNAILHGEYRPVEVPLPGTRPPITTTVYVRVGSACDRAVSPTPPASHR